MTALTDAERETLGERLMLQTTCNHGADHFGAGAVCETCWNNVQRYGRVFEAIITARTAALEAERDRLAAAVERVVEWRVTYYHGDERTGQNTFNTDAATDAARALAAYMEDCHDGRLAALHCRINGGEWMAVMPSVVVNRAALPDAGRGAQ